MKSSIKRTYTNRKTARPFSSKEAIHVVMRSRIAVGDRSLAGKRNRTWLSAYLPYLAKKCSVKVYRYSNNGNHLHLVLKAKERGNLGNFLRALSGMIARKVLGAEKGRKANLGFWDSRPYSRIITWGREFWSVLGYVERNALEAAGRLSYRCRTAKEQPAIRRLLAERAYLNQMDLRRG